MMDQTDHSVCNTLDSALDWACRQFASSVALLSPEQEPLSFRQLAHQIKEVKECCGQAGLGGGKRVGVLLPQGPENGVICLALMMGYGCVPLNPASTAAELQSQIKRLNLHAIVTVTERVSDIAPPLAVMTVSVDPMHRAGECLLSVHRKSSFDQDIRFSQPAPLVLQTSGSTADPKIVPLSSGNLLASCDNLTRSLALSPADRCLNMMPQFHIGALLDLLLAPLLAGGSVVSCRDMSSETFFAALEQFQPSWYQGVPTMLANILQFAERQPLSGKPHSMRFIRAVSSRMPRELHQSLSIEFSVPVVEIYGMTETAGVIASNPLIAGAQSAGSVGQSAGPEIAILDGAGNRAPVGGRGEIIVRGKNVFDGYEKAGGVDRDGHFVGDWFRTGDEGYFDEAGNLYLCGRLKEIINRGGEKISPEEVEQALLEHPSVSDTACFALPHASLGEDVYAVVSCCGGCEFSEPDLREFLKARLAEHKIPHRIMYTDTIPRSVGGKLQRRALVERYGAARQRNEKMHQLPDTEMGLLLARMWCEILKVPAVYDEDDFFELGGDSLKAASFLTALEDHLQVALAPGILFDHPVLKGLASQLEMEREKAGQTNAIGSLYLPNPLYEKLHRLMSVWPGQRRHPRALIIGHNTMGAQPPIFWCSSDKDNFSGLARALGADQPVYGMRSLHPLPERNAHNNFMLARHLFDELKTVQPEGPYYLGGYCEGGKIVRLLSQMLREAGDEVALLYLAEHQVQEPFGGRVAMLLTVSGDWSPLVRYPHPEKGWAKVVNGDLSLKIISLRHREFNAEVGLAEIASHLKIELNALKSGVSSPYRYPLCRIEGAQLLPPAACLAKLQGRIPGRLVPGQDLVVPVNVTNRGDRGWQAYAQSGILLTARWRRNHTDRIKVWQAGYTALPEILAPGETLALEVRVKVPTKIGGWTLELDLCDEGLCFFESHGSQVLRLPVSVFPGAGLLNRLAILGRDMGVSNAQ